MAAAPRAIAMGAPANSSNKNRPNSTNGTLIGWLSLLASLDYACTAHGFRPSPYPLYRRHRACDWKKSAGN